MKKNLAIYFDENRNYSIINNYIENTYKNWFYIYDVISIPNINHQAIIHYTDIRMRNIDVLITNIKDINKVFGFQNRIIYLLDSKNKIMNKDCMEYFELLKKVDEVWCDKISIEFIRNALHFKGETYDIFSNE